MSIFRDLEKRIDQQLKKLFSAENASAEGKELIEIQRAILDEIEDRAQMLPRAKRKFPYNDLLIRIPAVEPDRKAAIDLVFAEGGALQSEIEHHLRSEDIEFAADLQVRIEGLEQPPAEITAKGFHIVYSARQAQKAEAPSKRTVRFTVLHGTAEQTSYELAKSRIHIGRLGEVLDERRRPVRRNDVAFIESPEKPNSTISRAHAHLEYDASTGEFRLFDDGSAYGTSVMQDGRLSNVPAAGGRGLRLQSGDEIYVGQARVLFEIL
jgi:hypothetical protein